VAVLIGELDDRASGLMASARLVVVVTELVLIARFLKVAMTCGPCPV
jgi:hypothetical protein